MKRNGDVMRADRLKQVMQQIDSSFDEKNLGMSKFSRFVTEAAQRGLLTLTKLENGQFEVGPPRAGGVTSLPAGQETTEAQTRLPAPTESEAGERGRRGRRGGRGRDRDRDGRTPRVAQTAATETEAPSAEVARETTAAAETPRAASSAAGDGIGASGLRLRREEAFDLVRRAVASNGAAPVRASQARITARELLGRDSESLSERNFNRILQDAHDADVIDLRRRGNDYEVAPAAPATSVSEQLAIAEPPKPATPAAPSTPTGMGARGSGPSRGRGRGPIGARVGIVPADLLSVGVVEDSRPRAEVVHVESLPDLPLTGEDALSESDVKPRAGGRKRAPAGEGKPRRPRKSASAAADAGDKPAPRRAARKSRSKSASE
jgi:hypothetical protein